jgi:hypothetical protein
MFAARTSYASGIFPEVAPPVEDRGTDASLREVADSTIRVDAYLR